jgi:hypothetical protein
MAAAKKLIATLVKRDDKKNSVRFMESDNEALSNIYITNDGMETLGDPQKVKVTVEAVS